MRPHHYIFHRHWYEKYGGNEEFKKFKEEFDQLSDNEIEELKNLIKDYMPSKFDQILENKISNRVRTIIEYYRPLAPEELDRIYREQVVYKEYFKQHSPNLDDAERVEDAGLEIDPIMLEQLAKEMEDSTSNAKIS